MEDQWRKDYVSILEKGMPGTFFDFSVSISQQHWEKRRVMEEALPSKDFSSIDPPFDPPLIPLSRNLLLRIKKSCSGEIEKNKMAAL